MHYDEAKAALFAPAPEGIDPPPVSEGGAARRLRDAFEPVAMHAVWSPLVHERLAAHGLDFFDTYVWGRAFPMGEPVGAVVASAFAAFEPNLIAGVYDRARSLIDRETIRQVLGEAVADSLRATLGPDVEDEVATVGSRLADGVDTLDPTGRPLFAGVASLDRPADPYARLHQACLALREHRGDAHVAASRAAGFGPIEMNVLTELWLGYPLGEYSATRGWPEEATAEALDGLRRRGLLGEDSLTAEGHRARGEIEAATDRMEQGVVDVLGAELEATVRRLDEWGRRCIETETFPPDPRKRAAG